MNRICRLVWNHTMGVMVAVTKNAKGHGKSDTGRKLVAAAPSLAGGAFLTPLAQAGPAGAQESAGAGRIAQTGSATTTTQSIQSLAINLHRFRIGATRCFLALAINLHNGLEKITPALVKRIVGNLRQTEILLQAFGLEEIAP